MSIGNEKNWLHYKKIFDMNLIKLIKNVPIVIKYNKLK